MEGRIITNSHLSVPIYAIYQIDKHIQYRFFIIQITDFLFSPMILMMVLPVILLIILPRMMNDPETKKEMENMNLNKISSEMPEISEMITSFFTGSKPPPKKDDKPRPTTSKVSKKRN